MTLSDWDPQRSDDIAKALHSESGFRLLRQLQALGILEAAASEPKEAPAEHGSTKSSSRTPISVWQPVEREGHWHFERPQPGPFDDHYGKQMTFAQVKPEGRLRVAFFGESVAAGYLLAPHLTPAMVLERKLKRAFPGASIEILDFSRTNETLASMIQTADASCQLSPDAFVFFAGNNWPLLEIPEYTPLLPSVRTRQTLAGHWQRGRMAELKASEQRLLLQRVGAKLEVLGDLLKKRNIPAIWMIPEVNLLDWDHAQPPPVLDSKDLAGWYWNKDEALTFLTEGAFAGAEAACWRMLHLDQGGCPVGYRILGHALMGQGKVEQARLAFEYEVQNVGYVGSCFLGAPQITDQLRRLLLVGSHRHGFAVVDLKEIFSKARPDHLPDRHFFLDYCHLTKIGMATAMQSVIEPLGKALMLPGAQAVLLEEGCEMRPGAEAVACLGAAIHSCHRQLPSFPGKTPWQYWINQALALDERALDHLVNYVDVRLTKAPIVFSSPQASNFSQEFNLNPQHGWFYDYLDAPILQTILSVLEKQNPDLCQEMTSRLMTQFAAEKYPVDLLQPPYFLWQPLARMLTDVMAHPQLPKYAYLRCMLPQTDFAFITAGETDLELELTARLSADAAGKGDLKVGIQINGAAVDQAKIDEKWRSHSMTIPANLLKEGLNRMTLKWPMPTTVALAPKTHERLILGREACFHPQFGQVFSLKIASADA